MQPYVVYHKQYAALEIEFLVSHIAKLRLDEVRCCSVYVSWVICANEYCAMDVDSRGRLLKFPRRMLLQQQGLCYLRCEIVSNRRVDGV